MVLYSKYKPRVKKCLKNFIKIGLDNDISSIPWV